MRIPLFCGSFILLMIFSTPAGYYRRQMSVGGKPVIKKFYFVIYSFTLFCPGLHGSNSCDDNCKLLIEICLENQKNEREKNALTLY